MRILQLCPYFLPYPGGQERYVYYLSRELVRQGHEVTVITSNFPKTSPHEYLDGISVYRYPCFGRPLRNPITPRLFYPQVDITRFDVIHAHNEHSSAAIASAYLSMIHKVPMVITSHGKLVFGSWLADMIREFYWSSVGRSILFIANKIIVATPSDHQRLAKSGIPSSRINIIPVGIDLKFWDSFPKIGSDDFKRKYNILDHDIILVATQLIKRKGIHYLIKAMGDVIVEFPKSICVIAGAGSYEHDLHDLTQKLDLTDHVLFIGLLNDFELAQAYQAANVFILPSLGEGQPTCVMEAWVFSKPVISTNIAGILDYFSESAVLVEPGNSKVLSEAIIKVLSTNELAKFLGHKGRALIEQKFQWGQVTNQILEVYNSVIES